MRNLTAEVGVGVFKKKVSLKEVVLSWTVNETEQSKTLSLDMFIMELVNRVKRVERAILKLEDKVK